MFLNFHQMQRRLACRALLSAIALTSGVLPTPAAAGGSWEPVRVLKLSRSGETAYTLIVEPSPNNDPYLKGCRRFEVRGALSRLEGEWPFGRPRGPSKKEHLAALKYLQSSEHTGKFVNFGSVGEGFRIIDPKQPCIFRSRGLRIIDGAVVSYFHMT